ncbi:MAG: hypothetical protein AAFW47_04815 [Pseudomonadota bacterium]
MFRFRLVLTIVGVIALTILTQIGGVALVLALFLVRWVSSPYLRTIGTLAGFVAIYVAATVLVVPPLAAQFGRVPLSCAKDEAGHIQSPLYCALNRHYVTPQTSILADRLATHMDKAFPGTQTLFLDANFPFLDGFPLLPHLSHDDGRKLDIAFYYRDASGYRPGKTASPIGFWAFEEPLRDEPQPCGNRRDILTLRWDMTWFQAFNSKDLSLEPDRTAEALRWLSEDGVALGVEKILLEPHLKERMGLQNDVIRFQGCRAARHDDHIHIQVRLP